MKSSKIINIFKDGNITIPLYLFKNIKSLGLDYNEFIFLMYLYNKGNNWIFNPEVINNDLGIDTVEIMELISNLSEKGIIKVDVKKNEKGFMEDIICLDNFYNKIKLLVIDELNESDSSKITDSTIFDYIEKEFGRTLSSIDYEIIKAWLEKNISEELIKEAVKEATINGVSSLKYIDKILYEWGKKGFTTVKEVEESKGIKINNKDSDSEIDLDIVDWDWFDEDG